MGKNLQWDSTRKGWRFTVRGESSAVFFAASKSDAGALYTLYRQSSGKHRTARSPFSIGWPYDLQFYKYLRRGSVFAPMQIHGRSSTGKGGAYEVVTESVEVDGKVYTRTWKRIRPGGPLWRRLSELRARCGEVAG